MYQTTEISLPDISCISCVRPLQETLEHQKEALNLNAFFIDISHKTLYLRFNKQGQDKHAELLGRLTQLIDNHGLEWQYSSDALQPSPHSPRHKTTSLLQSHWLLAALGLLSGSLILVLSLTGIPLSFTALLALTAVAIPLSLYLSAPSFYHAWKNWHHQKILTMDSLFALSNIVILSVSLASLFFPGLPMMLEASLLIFGFRHLGKGIEERLISRSTGTRRFQDRLPERCRKILGDADFMVKTAHLSKDDIITVQGGEIIPCDSVLLSPEAKIIDTLVSGLTDPKKFALNDALLSGMKLAPGQETIRLLVTAPANESNLAKMDADLIATQNAKAPMEKLTGELLQYFIPAVLLIAFVSGVGFAFAFPLALAIKCAAAVLVSACPCTLGLIVPLAMKVGIKKSKEHGVHFKNPEALETASSIDTIVFDLNGSLTMGKPSVHRFNLIQRDFDKRTCLAIVAQMEQKSEHPLGKALARFCQSDTKDTVPVEMQEHQKIPGGVSARIRSQRYFLGNARCMADNGIDLPEDSEHTAPPGEQRLYLAQGRQLIAVFYAWDCLRAQAKITVQQLQKASYAVHICTGADAQTTAGYAKLLGIPESCIKTNCVALKNEPHEHTKSDYIAQLQAQGAKVAMIGDAGNDSLALKKSDLGIAMQSDSSDEMTKENAHVLMTKETCLPLLHCFSIARQSMRNIKENLLFSLLYNCSSLLLSGGLLVTLGLSMNPAVGAALMVLQMSLILLNVYRFAHRKNQYSALERDSKTETESALEQLGLPQSLLPRPSPLPNPDPRQEQPITTSLWKLEPRNTNNIQQDHTISEQDSAGAVLTTTAN
ncbi:MAG: cation-translocating P-type ATPase [Legionellaceae bacterium]|nr:cation-translocating P-type ATPase [Legionellaceae bacterium]